MNTLKTHRSGLKQQHVRLLMGVVFLWGLSWSVAAEVSVQGELTHELELLPGSTHSGSIVLRNNGPTPSEVKMYQTDYRSEAPGQHFYEDPGTHDRSNAAWVSISPLRFTVPPEETYTVSYVIEVPADPAMTGTYWSVLMIEPIPSESPESSEADPNETSVGILTLIRYGFKFVTHIGSTGTVDPKIEDVSLTMSDGVPSLGVAIRNEGSRLLKIDIWAELYDDEGNFVAKKDGAAGSLYPASAREYQIFLDGVGTGSYTSLIIIDAGDNNVFGASLPLLLE